ncbi:MAG: hypothetical protein EOO46_06445 [Flavobacterium sp.]|nr:MAG: hypothetical protein EOO46_06445 [Flavobacterium sp.]
MKQFIILFLVLTSYCHGQETFSFVSKIHPEKTYSLQMDISSVNETTVNEKTTKSQSISRITRTTTTKKSNEDGKFSATMKFGEVIVSGDGKEVLSPISQTIINGLLSEDSKFKIDTIINPRLDKPTKDAIKSAFKDLKPDIDFPKNALKIGDSFEHKMPMNISIYGEQVKIAINKTFTLKSVVNNIAEFTLTEIITLNMESLNISANGEGNGIVQFNISENQIIKDKSHFTINILLKKDDLVVKGFVESDSEKTTRIQ